MKKLLSLFIVFAMMFGIAGCNSENHEGEAKTPSGSSVQKGRDYQTVYGTFEEKGFTNIRLEKLDDLVTGWITKEGEVESVSVDGNTDYSSDTWYPSDVEVIITYHVFPDKESENTQNSEVPDVSSPNSPEEGVLTVENCQEFADILNIKADVDPSYEKFAETYKNKVVEFDGCITYLTNHENYDTRYDLLISAGDYIDENTINPGPTFKLKDIGVYKLGDGLALSDFVRAGANIKIQAKIKSYNTDTGLFELALIFLEER